MGIVGIKFRENFIFVPEVLACARAMKAGMAHIEPILSASGVEPIGTVIMGTVKGDLHDIGKNLCIMMLRGSGFAVIDLGSTPRPTVHRGGRGARRAAARHVGAADHDHAQHGQDDRGLHRCRPARPVKIMVGGAPVTQEFADDMGADGYGKDALACVALAKQLLGVAA